MSDVKALLVIIILLISLVGQAICLGVLRRKGMRMIIKIKLMLTWITPRIHNLRNVIYIKWIGKEWFIRKY